MDNEPGSTLPLHDREQVLEHAASLILASWRSFDHARPQQPLPVARHIDLLGARRCPAHGSSPIAALDAAADVLDVSLAQARPRYFAYIGSSGLEIGVLGDALMASHDVNVAVSAGAADLLEAQTVRWLGEFVGFDAAAVGVVAAGGTISNLTALTAARERALPGFRHDGAAAARWRCTAHVRRTIRSAARPSCSASAGATSASIPLDCRAPDGAGRAARRRSTTIGPPASSRWRSWRPPGPR